MFFVPRAPQSPWGDYGHMLVHGMTAHLPRAGDKLRLERTGPFMPPITFPGIGDIVVTDQVRKAIEANAFVGIRFRPVVKERIVRLDWQRWNQTDDAPAVLPRTFEPEDYILGRRHSAALARKLGRLWELLPTTVPATPSSRGWVVLRSHPRADLCRHRFRADSFVSMRLRDWLASNFGACVAFERAKVRTPAR
jgi:hypothetical protein